MPFLRILFLLAFAATAFSAPIRERSVDPQALEQLMKGLGMDLTEDPIVATQREWLRKPNHERWEVTELTPEQREFVLGWGRANELYDEWKPIATHYHTALILGATTSRMETRLAYLAKLWDEGVRFTEIVWLTGERPLDPRVDQLTDRCKNEAEAAKIIWKEASLPEEMRELPVVFVAVPMKTENGILKRPTTEDTIVAWLHLSPPPAPSLFVSDQPFCGYQYAVIKKSLPDEFLFEVVGMGVDPEKHPLAAAVTLDSLARWLYTEAAEKK